MLASRSDFPVVDEYAFFAHAAVSPLPGPSVACMRQYLEDASRIGQFGWMHREVCADLRQLLASLLGRRTDEIYLTSSTTAALVTLRDAFAWREGDRVLIPESDYPALIHPWVQLRDRGVFVDRIPVDSIGRVRAADVVSRIDRATRLVALSAVNHISGATNEIELISTALRARGVPLVLDAVQAVGAVSMDFSMADAVVCGGQKWLLGPLGTGCLAVSNSLLDRLTSPVAAAGNSDVDETGHVAFRPGSRVFELDSMNVAGLIGLCESLRILQREGIQTIHDYLLELQAQLVRVLDRLGIDRIQPSGSPPAHLVSFAMASDQTTEALWEHLNDQHVVTSKRGFGGKRVIRVAPHFYCSDHDLSRLTSAITAFKPGAA